MTPQPIPHAESAKSAPAQQVVLAVRRTERIESFHASLSCKQLQINVDKKTMNRRNFQPKQKPLENSGRIFALSVLVIGSVW
jgi:hypothetical protein